MELVNGLKCINVGCLIVNECKLIVINIKRMSVCINNSINNSFNIMINDDYIPINDDYDIPIIVSELYDLSFDSVKEELNYRERLSFEFERRLSKEKVIKSKAISLIEDESSIIDESVLEYEFNIVEIDEIADVLDDNETQEEEEDSETMFEMEV